MTAAGCLGSGDVSNMYRTTPHDWRLIEEIPASLKPVGWNPQTAWAHTHELLPPKTRWYCTRCRLIETREEPDPRVSPEG